MTLHRKIGVDCIGSVTSCLTLKGLLMSQKMIYITIHSESWLIGEAWLEQLVDDVVQKYDVMHFKIAPI